MKKGNALDALAEKAAELFDLPERALRGTIRVEIDGTGQVYMENHRGIIEYGPGEIAVDGGKCVVRVRGEGLALRAMTRDELLITGRLAGLELER